MPSAPSASYAYQMQTKYKRQHFAGYDKKLKF